MGVSLWENPVIGEFLRVVVKSSESAFQLLQLQEGDCGQLSLLVAPPDSVREPVQVFPHFGAVFVEAGVETQKIAAELSHRPCKLLHGEYDQIIHAVQRLQVSLSGGIAAKCQFELNLRQFQKILLVGAQQFGLYVLFIVPLIGDDWQSGQRLGNTLHNLDSNTQVGLLQQFVIETKPLQGNIHRPSTSGMHFLVDACSQSPQIRPASRRHGVVEVEQFSGSEMEGKVVVAFEERQFLVEFGDCPRVHATLYRQTIIQPHSTPLRYLQNYKEINAFWWADAWCISWVLLVLFQYRGQYFSWWSNRKIQNLMLALKAPYQKVSRTFVFEREQTMQSQILDLTIDLSPQSIDLHPLLAAHTPPRALVSLYDPNPNAFVPLRKLALEDGLFPSRLLQPSVILVRFREREQKADTGSGSEFEADSGQRKDMRSRERTVGEAIELVRQWRALHLSHPKPSNLRKKVNLQQAARMLGVSKKSLDDYYCQLRLAEHFGFDFHQNLHEKMGVLRSFVKERKGEEQRQQHRPSKHPKNLKIIENMDLQNKLSPKAPCTPRRSDPSFQGDDLSVKPPSEPNRSTVEMAVVNSLRGMVWMDVLQEEFFRNFEFLLDDPPDPFLALNTHTSKRILEEDRDGYFLI